MKPYIITISVFTLVFLSFIAGSIFGKNLHTLEVTDLQVFIECKDTKISIQKPNEVGIFWNKKFLTEDTI